VSDALLHKIRHEGLTLERVVLLVLPHVHAFHGEEANTGEANASEKVGNVTGWRGFLPPVREVASYRGQK